MYGHPLSQQYGYTALRRAERRAAMRARLLTWAVAAGGSLAFLVACGLLDRAG